MFSFLQHDNGSRSWALAQHGHGSVAGLVSLDLYGAHMGETADEELGVR